MARMSQLLVLFLSIIMSIISSSYAQSCARYTFSSNKLFRACNDLPYLNSFLHWNYDSSSNKLQIAYRHTGITSPSNTWVAWAINPTSTGMVGSQALIAYQQSDGTMKAYPSPITAYQTSLKEEKLSFDVSDLSATYAKNEIIIFATLGLSNTSTTVNQVWQDGPLSGNSPQMHITNGANVKSMGTINLLSGESSSAGGNDKIKKRNVSSRINVSIFIHGLLISVLMILVSA